MHPVSVDLRAAGLRRGIAGGHGHIAGVDKLRAVADFEVGRQLVGGPQAERTRRGVGQRLAFLHGVFARCGFQHFAAQLGVRRKGLPLVGDFAGGSQLEALHALLALQFERAVFQLDAAIGFVDAEDCCVKRQALVQQLPFGAQFPGLVLFRVEVLVAHIQAAAGGRQVLCRGVVRVAPGHIDGAVLDRFVGEADTAAEHLVRRFQLGAHARCQGAAVILALVALPTQPQAQIPLFAQRQGIEGIQRLIGQLGIQGRGVAAVARPDVVARRVVQVVNRAEIQVITEVGAFEGFPGYLNTGDQRVLDKAGGETPVQVGLVDRQLGGGVAAVAAARAILELARADTAAHRLHVAAGGHRAVIHFAVTADAVQADQVVEIVFELGGQRVDIDLFGIDIAEAEVVIAIDPGEYLAGDGRQAVLRQVFVGLMQVAQGQARGAAQAKGNRGGNPPALVVDLLTTGHVVFVGHQIEAECTAVDTVQRLIDVGRQTAITVGAQASLQVVGRAQTRRLADHVDRARRGASAGIHRARAFDHLDHFQVEHVGAGHVGAVAQAIDHQVVGRTEATDVDAVAVVAALTRAEGNPRHVGQHLAQAQRVLLADHGLRHHGDGLRGVEQRRGVFRRGRAIDFITLVLLPLNRDAAELDWALLRVDSSVGSQAGAGPGCHCETDSRGQ